MEVWQDKIKGTWSYKFEHEGIAYSEEGFRSNLDCRSTGQIKYVAVVTGEGFTPETRESKEKPLFKDAATSMGTKSKEHTELKTEKVTTKISAKVTTKNDPTTHSTQGLDENGNSKSNHQNISESNHQSIIQGEGYIKAYRKTMKSWIFQNEGIFKLWMWCLFKASHTEQWVPVKTGKGITEVHLSPGEFVFGKYVAAKELRMKPSTVWKRITKLMVHENLVVKSNRQYSVITIVNWDTYQGGRKKSNHRGTTEEPPSRPYKNVKKEKPYSLTSIEVQLSELLLRLILGRRNTFKGPKNIQDWAEHIDLMLRVDKRDSEEIEQVIRWCQVDEFWQNNVLSTSKLRKQYDQLALKMGEQTRDEKQKARPEWA